MTKKLFSYLFLVMSVMLIAVPMSVEASDGTVISTIVPQKYTITFDIDGGGSVEYEDVLYKDGDTIQVMEGTDLKLILHMDNHYKLKSVSFNGKDLTKQVSDSVITIKNVQQNGTLAVTYVKRGSIATPTTGDEYNILLLMILTLGSIGTLAYIRLQAQKSKHS